MPLRICRGNIWRKVRGEIYILGMSGAWRLVVRLTTLWGPLPALPATLAGCPPPPTPTARTLSYGLSLNLSRFLQCCVDFCSFLQCWPPSAAQCKGCGCGQRSTKERAELKHLASRKFQLIDAFNDFVRPFEGERGAGREGRTGEWRGLRCGSKIGLAGVDSGEPIWIISRQVGGWLVPQ